MIFAQYASVDGFLTPVGPPFHVRARCSSVTAPYRAQNRTITASVAALSYASLG